jgi:hypothetical protein
MTQKFTWSSAGFHNTQTRRGLKPTGPMCFVFCRLYPFFPPATTMPVFGPYLSSLSTNDGTQKEDERGPFGIQSSLPRVFSYIDSHLGF